MGTSYSINLRVGCNFIELSLTLKIMINTLKPSYEYMQPLKYIGALLLEKRTSTELGYNNFDTETINNLSPALTIDTVKLCIDSKIKEIIAIKFWVAPATAIDFSQEEIMYLKELCEKTGIRVSYLLVEFPQHLSLSVHELHPVALY